MRKILLIPMELFSCRIIMKMKWLLFLGFINSLAFVKGLGWPIQSLVFDSSEDKVYANINLSGEQDLSGEANVMHCGGNNLTWSDDTYSYPNGSNQLFRSAEPVMEGSHAVCMLNNVTWLNLSVPCLDKAGVPKPIITTDTIRYDYDSSGQSVRTLFITWMTPLKNLLIEEHESYCTDEHRSIRMTDVQSGNIFVSTINGTQGWQKGYCCVAYKSKLNGTNYRTCDCQHFDISEMSTLRIQDITMLQTNGNYCVNFHWTFYNRPVEKAGVCCSPSHLLFYETCNSEQVKIQSSTYIASWCGTYGQGNYQLHCYAFNEVLSDGNTVVSRSKRFTSSIDAPSLQSAVYMLQYEEHKTCIVATWIIPRSFYSLTQYSLCCHEFGCVNDTMQKMTSTHNSLNLSLQTCLIPDKIDFTLFCVLQNNFHPNKTSLAVVELFVPVRIWTQGFQAAYRSADWEVDRSVCFKLQWVANAKLDNRLIKECCSSDRALTENIHCTETGKPLCITSENLSLVAYCYTEFQGNYTQRSNIVEKDLLAIRLAGMNITETNWESQYRPLVQIDYSLVSEYNLTASISIKNSGQMHPLSFGVHTETWFSPSMGTLDFEVVVSHQGAKKTYALTFPEAQKLEHINVERIFENGQFCAKFTWMNLNKTVDYINIPIAYLQSYQILCKTQAYDQYFSYRFERPNSEIENNHYSHSTYCTGMQVILDCYVKTVLTDSKNKEIAIGVSDIVHVALQCENPTQPNISIEYDSFTYDRNFRQIHAIYNISWKSEKNCFDWRQSSYYELHVTQANKTVMMTNESRHQHSFDVDSNYVIELYAFNSANLNSKTSQWIQTVSTAPKNVQLAAMNSNCIEIKWNSPDVLHEERTFYQVQCLNADSEHNVTDTVMMACIFQPFTLVNCSVSAHSTDWISPLAFSNSIVMPCGQPSKIAKLYATQEILVDAFGNLIAITWNITWQPAIPHCDFILYYNVTVEKHGVKETVFVQNPKFHLRCEQVNQMCNVSVFAVNDQGLSGEILTKSFIFKEQAPTHAPLLYIESSNYSCARISVKKSEVENSATRYYEVDCISMNGKETVLNLTVKTTYFQPLTACVQRKPTQMKCSAAIKNLAGKSIRVEAVYTFSERQEETTTSYDDTSPETDDNFYVTTEFEDVFSADTRVTTVKALPDRFTTQSSIGSGIKSTTSALQESVLSSLQGIHDTSTTLMSQAPTATVETTEEESEKLRSTSPRNRVNTAFMMLSLGLKLL